MKETGKWIHKQKELLYLMELNLRCVAIAPATQLQDKSDQHKLLLEWAVYWGPFLSHYKSSLRAPILILHGELLTQLLR